MNIIDEIIDLARVMEPGNRSEKLPRFELVRGKDGLWSARVDMHTYWHDVTDKKTHEEALACIRDNLRQLNLEARDGILSRLARWITGNGGPKLQKIDGGK